MLCRVPGRGGSPGWEEEKGWGDDNWDEPGARVQALVSGMWDVGCGIQGLAKSELCGQANNCRRVVQLLRQAFQRAACRAREHGRESGVGIAAAAG